MERILALQGMATTAKEDEGGNSGISATCNGNSCISFNCGGSAN